MYQFVSGAALMALVTAGLFFLRFHRETGERLFAVFAAAFWLLALERVIVAALGEASEMRPYVYLIRLVAFLLIIAGIIDKNRSRTPATPRP
jgi:hypothetical protein